MLSNPTLWQRIQAHRFDEPGAALSFTDRLCQEQGWPKDFALRAIEEYRRFAYLACVAGREVTPSREVDAVWHLHLTYSRDYWEVFCAETLDRPLHHTPTTGGAAADKRYRANYLATLQIYRREFDEQPAGDLWPPADVRFAPLRTTIARSHDRPTADVNTLQRYARRQPRAKQWLIALATASPLVLVLYGVLAYWGASLALFWLLAIVLVGAAKVYLTADKADANAAAGDRRRSRDGAYGAGAAGLGAGIYIGVNIDGSGNDGGGGDGGGGGGGGGCGGGCGG